MVVELLRMDIQARIRIVSSHSLCSKTLKSSNSSSSSKFLCSSGRDSRKNDNANNDNGDETDWDKAWKSYRRQGKSNNKNNNNKEKKPLFSRFSADKYVSWNPRRSEFPLSEEIDPIRRTERSNLKFWTSPEFTLGGAIVLVTFLLIYTLLVPVK